jgi:peptide subunit release factor 1 (eRF1)
MELEELVKKLTVFDPAGFPVISLYLNTQPDEHGRDHFDRFVRKQCDEIAKNFPQRSTIRASFDHDVERIKYYLENDLEPSANGAAIFACSGAELFETAQLYAPFERHRISVSDHPDLYPLVRLLNQYDRYVALLADTNSARLYVFGLGQQLEEKQITNIKTNRSQVGGWSQANFQRRTENFHLLHAKEVVDALERVVREEQIDYIILSGDEVIIPLLLEQMPKELIDKIADVLRIPVKAPQHEFLQATLEVMHERQAHDDAERVKKLLDEYRSGGLAVVGARNTLKSLEIGQVAELIIDADRGAIDVRDVKIDLSLFATASDGRSPAAQPRAVAVAERMVTLAQQTGAQITFIKEDSLLAGVGGVGAFLRYKVD